MGFAPLLVTNQGLEALSEVTGTGATLALTKVEAGSGYAGSGDIIGNFTALKAYVMDADSTSTNTAVLYQSTIRCNITATNAPKTFQLNEFGVFASLNGQAPFLFAYASTGAPSGDTVDPGAPIVKEYVLPIVYATTQQVTTSITMTDTVGLHGATHLPTGIDPLPIAGQTIGGLCPKTPNDTAQVLLGGSTAGFAPLPLHGPTHVSTGRDPVPVATPTATGLLPKLSNDPATVLLGTGAWGASFLPGFIIEYAGYTVPAGWLACDGQAYSRTTYAGLYAALGGAASPWGQGDGSTSFNVPDLRGRFTVTAGAATGLTTRAVGQTGGEETHLLTLAETPAHSHAIVDNGHTHTVYEPQHTHTLYDPQHTHGIYDPTHTHGYIYGNWTTSGVGNAGTEHYNNFEGDTGPAATNISVYSAKTNMAVNPATIGVSVYTAKTGITGTQPTGGGGAHNNMPPFVVVQRIIHT